MNTNNNIRAVTILPLLVGLNYPKSANDKVAKHILNNCTPDPTKTANKIGRNCGGLKISP